MYFRHLVFVCFLSKNVHGATLKSNENRNQFEGFGLNNRIVGGNDVDKGEYPFLAWVYINDTFVCLGSIIDDYNVLTAAHCVIPGSENWYKVLVGDYDPAVSEPSEQIRSVAKAVIDPRYVPFSGNLDVAVLQMSSPFELNDEVGSINLASKNQEKKFLATGKCKAVGQKSAAFPGMIQDVAVDIKSKRFCTVFIGFYGLEFTKYMMCGFKPFRTICDGDKGGPLVCFKKDKVVQVGISLTGDHLCNGLGLFARVSALKSWINDNKLRA